MPPRYSSDLDEERDFDEWREGDRDDEGGSGASAGLDVLDGLVGKEFLEVVLVTVRQRSLSSSPAFRV
ncbi:hypothetical protein PIB30_022834 [Stylosanthes scabra]|uniref:Uncharacterized protein n=1 Tax=Stylosanthes scabra TaxID=79078 RepID=A0ABU6WB59_9FABA|nr:hypothetical protein [Stylosanthes scabra]